MRHRRPSTAVTAILGVVVSLAGMIGSPVRATPGDLDSTFDLDGRVTTDFAARSDEGSAVVLQPDGKFVMVGSEIGVGTTNSGDFALARYNDDGSLDTSFDTDGKLTTDFAGGRDAASAFVLQPDGKLVAAGRAFTGGPTGFADFALARYNDDGSLDTSFDTDGMLTTDFAGSFDQATALVLQPDGKLVAAGSAVVGGSVKFALARYNDDGSLDTSFDTDGTLTTDFGGSGGEASALVLQPDGKLVAAGSAVVGGSEDFALARYNDDGSLDTSFDTDGKLTTDVAGESDFAHAVVLQPDTKLVAAGSADVGGTPNFALVRYNDDGSLDSSFDTDGMVTTDFGGSTHEALTLLLQPDGRLVAAGTADVGGSNTGDFALARYNGDGSPDTSFDADGVLTTDFAGGQDAAYGLALQPDGKLVASGRAVVGGTFTFDFALARYEGDPVNGAPLAAADAYVTNEDTILSVIAPGVLDNDTDPDGDPLTAALVAEPLHGTATLASDGSFVYTPASNYHGPDSFTYKTEDGALSSTPATVTITVVPVNDAPVAVGDSYNRSPLGTLRIPAPGVLGNDTDIDGDPLSAVLVTGPTRGTLVLKPDGSFTYRPRLLSLGGTDTFTYQASDGTRLSNPVTVTIRVNLLTGS